MPRIKGRQQGQATVELVLVFSVVILFFISLLLIIYLMGISHSIKFISEEALYCSLHSEASSCEQKALRTFHEFPLLQIENFHISSLEQQRTLFLEWSFQNPVKSFGLPDVFSHQQWELKSNTHVFDQ